MWERWPYQRIGMRTYMRSTYDRAGGNEMADASHFLYQLADDRNVTLEHEEQLHSIRQQAYEKGFLDGDRVGKQAGFLIRGAEIVRCVRFSGQAMHLRNPLINWTAHLCRSAFPG